MSPAPGRSAGTTQTLSSVASAARILKQFGHGDTQLGVSQLARRTGISRSSAHRIVRTFVTEGLLEKVEATGLYRLSATMRNLGISAETSLSLHQAATTPLDWLRSVTDHTLHIAILDGKDVLYLERRESPNALQVFGRVGSRNSAHVTATGKVLLAGLPHSDCTALVESMRLIRRTPHSITSRTNLLAEVAKVRRQGYGENVFESEPGVVSVAAPILDRTGQVVAAVSVAAVVEDDRSDCLRPVIRPLLAAAGRISKNLGWQRGTDSTL